MKAIHLTICMLVALLGVSVAFGQDETLRPHWRDSLVKEVQEQELPKEAKETGLGGVVKVLVQISSSGKVMSAEVKEGPDWICPSIARPDVVSLRNFAKEAALKTKLSPAHEDGKPGESFMHIIYDFPTTKTHTTVGTADVPPGPVLNGKAVKLSKPSYPPAARALRASGAVNIQVLLDTDGSVFSARAVSGHPLLRAASRKAACDSRFKPTLLSGEPVKVSGIITYNFVP